MGGRGLEMDGGESRVVLGGGVGSWGAGLDLSIVVFGSVK